MISTPVFKLPLTGYGGLEALAWYQAKGLAELGHQVMLMCPDNSTCPNVQIVPIGPAGGVDEQMAYSGFPEIRHGWQVVRPAHAGYWQNLLNVDVCIDHSWQKCSSALRKEGRLKAPVLAVCHAPVDTMFKELPPPGVLSFVCISEDQGNHFRTLFSRDCRVAHNGIDLNMYRPLDVPRSSRFLFLARFSYIKGAHLAIEACKKAGVGLDLIGDTRLTGEPEYLQSIVGMGDGKQIRFVGPASRGETVWWFSQAHCMLHPNKHFCHLPSQKIATTRGSVTIDEVSTSDEVLGIDGKFHKVSAALRRSYSGPIRVIQHSSFSGRLQVTPDHPIWVVKPRVCACMGAGAGLVCKPTYGGYSLCREITEQTIKKQKVYDKAVQLHLAGAGSPKISKELGVAETTVYYWTSGRTPRPERDLEMPYCDNYVPYWEAASSVEVGDLVVTPIPKSKEQISVEVPKRAGNLIRCRSGFIRLVKTKRGKIVPKVVKYRREFEISEEFLRLCGWYIAEGHEDGGTARFSLNIKEEEYASEIAKLGKNILGADSSTYLRLECNTRIVAVNDHCIGHLFKEWFGGNARLKKMPQWMFELPAEKVKHVLRTMWRGDGCVVHSGKYQYLSYTTVSPSLATQLWMTLTKLGVIGYLVEKKASPKAKNAGKTIYNLNVRGDSAKKLAEILEIPFVDGRGGKAWKGISFIHNGLIYSRVTSVAEMMYEGDVFNLTVPEGNSYIAQLAGSHNCEPFGLAPVESLACGTPVIAWDYGAMRETVVNDLTGNLVKSMDELVTCVKKQAQSDWRKECRDKCRQQALKFSIERMCRRYEELCREAISTGGWS